MRNFFHSKRLFRSLWSFRKGFFRFFCRIMIRVLDTGRFLIRLCVKNIFNFWVSILCLLELFFMSWALSFLAIFLWGTQVIKISFLWSTQWEIRAFSVCRDVLCVFPFNLLSIVWVNGWYFKRVLILLHLLFWGLFLAALQWLCHPRIGWSIFVSTRWFA